jgi:CheY-like chemotaxis protein
MGNSPSEFSGEKFAAAAPAGRLTAHDFRQRVRMNAYRLLHVEDEPDIREVVEISIALDPGVTLKSCACGLDALAAAADWQPDMILMDVMMPVMDGPKVLARLRENVRTADIPVIFMTARAQTKEVERFLSLGAAGVIAKPFDPMTLAASVRAYLHAEQ